MIQPAAFQRQVLQATGMEMEAGKKSKYWIGEWGTLSKKWSAYIVVFSQNGAVGPHWGDYWIWNQSSWNAGKSNQCSQPSNFFCLLFHKIFVPENVLKLETSSTNQPWAQHHYQKGLTITYRLWSRHLQLGTTCAKDNTRPNQSNWMQKQ